MAEILKEWLTNRLQRTIQWEAKDFGDMMKNGHIIASVLHSYHVINDEKLYLIRSSNASIDIKNNWEYLTEWLRQVDVHLPPSEVNSVMAGKGSALLRLFYQLFLHLDKRDRTDFLKRERKMVSSLVEKMENRFKVEKVVEEEDPVVDHLSKPLLDEKVYIDWQRKKAAEVKDMHDYIRHRYSKTLGKIEESRFPCSSYVPPKPKTMTSKEKKDIEKFHQKYPCKFHDYTYEELLGMEEASVQRKKSLLDSDWANSYMNDLYSRLNQKTDSEQFQTNLRNEISNSMWDDLLGEEESKVDLDLAKKVMKLSQFEKQMCTQIMETKQQARNLVKNRIDAEREFTEQRDQQFQQYLDAVREQIHLEVVEIDFEKFRQKKLHKRLYAEKMKRKRQHYYEICYETMLSLVDYATKYAYISRLLEDDIPDHFIHEWKTLFFRKQPIFDILDPMEDLLKEHALEEEPAPEEEEIIRLELDRQEALNDSEFIEYHNYLHAWTLDLLIPNYDPESEERKYEYLGTRILGHLVYSLLEIKYPYPPPRPPADLPEFKVKALICNLPDKSITIPMQILLNKMKIHVVRLENSINFCLRKFRHEMIGITDIELNFDKFANTCTEEEGKEMIKTLKNEDEFYSKSIDMSAISGPIPPNCKVTQTPKTLPEEDMTLSLAAELGKYTFEALSLGDSLTDHLLAAMIVEYIKDQENIEGFVIINYPNSYREAQILEETFSGREPPLEGELEDKDDIYLEEAIIKHRKKEKDPHKEIRVSRLVHNPHKKRIDKPFESYFTCYLKLKETEDILQEYVIWDLTPDNSELIDRFYASLGMNYSLYYEVIDKDLLAQICKYIIGDFAPPVKSCDTLFGENVLSLLDFPSSDDRRTKSKIVKPELSVTKSKDKLRRGLSKGTRSNMQDLEIYKAPESNEDIVQDEPITVTEQMPESEAESKSETTTEDVKLLAGEEDWDYGELPIPENIGIALATCWQEVEKTYIHDMEQLFFAKRLQMNCLIPYCRFIRDKMEQIITLPSYKQDLVSQFQKEYNDFEDDWRDVNLTKNEWHCRIKELQSKLYHICDERKIFSEQQKTNLLLENWTAEELVTMANTYISCLQTELNRSTLTFQALHDFYFAMIRKLPPNDRLTSKELIKITREVVEDSVSDRGKKGQEDKLLRQLKNAYIDMYMKNIEIDFHNNPLNFSIESNVKLAQKIVKDINDHYRSIISREYSEVAKMVPNVKKKDDTVSVESLNLEEIFKFNALKCIDEWLMGINGEMYRANLRFLALQYKCYKDMKLFNGCIFKTVSDIQDYINTHYMNEIRSVDRLCKYLQMAVENGKKIPETLVLDQDQFIIDPNLLQFATTEPPGPDSILSEIVQSYEFKIGQLARLRSQFKIVAPTGVALNQAFIYLLQDFIFFGKESCEGPIFPELWKSIDPEQVPKLVYLLFGETAYVDWRDFLIYCLNIRFPTVEELLDLRKTFRCYDRDLETNELISRNDYLKEVLWFESDFDPDDPYAQLRKALIKHFIFELFETAEDRMNYSAMLLAFCKHPDPIQGFAAAISMAVGRKTCFSLAECEEVVCKLIKLKQYRDECLACALKCTGELLERVLSNVITFCEGTTITEVQFTEPEIIEDKKKKKGGKGGKEGKLGKTPSQSMSARTVKGKDKGLMPSQSKQTQSETDVKQTFICRPCEDVPTPEEKPEEKEEVEEEHRSSIAADPTLAYAVSQDVIWNVLRVCLPWHFVYIPEEKRTPYYDQVQEAMKKLEVNTETGDIYVSMFVTDPNVCKILHKVKKFTALNVAEEVRKVCV